MTNSLIDSLGGTAGNRTQSISMNGVITAVVTNIQDPEKQGRIKVKFLGQGAVNETSWVRVASFYAGKERGIFFLPEVNDEVLVAFIRGNIDFPVVIGSLWSSVDTPPETNADGKNNIKLIKTKAGHTITLCDDKETQKAKIEIKSSAGHIITLDDAAGQEKIEIQDKGGGKITMDATQKAISIESAMKLEIKAKMMTIEANTITIEAKTNLQLKGAMLKAEGSGITEIKGGLVKIN